MQSFEAKKLIGHQACPECGQPDADIKTDKSGNPYRYCSGCNAQYFTRGDAVRVRNMVARMRPIEPAAPVKVEAPAAPVKVEAPAAPVKVEAPAAPVKVKAPAKAAPVAPVKPKKWFATMMDAE